MTIWADEKDEKGEWKDISIHLIACPRGSGRTSLGVIQGVVYSVKSITETSVVMEMLEEYCPGATLPAGTMHSAEDEFAEDAFEGRHTGRMGTPEGLTFPNAQPELIDVSNAKKEVTVPLVDIPAVMRLTHAMCYYTVQGRTLQGHTLLLDTTHPNFSRRALIVGLSRATHGDRVHVASSQDAKTFVGERRKTIKARRVVSE
jgi:hypothetical protein